MKHQALARVFAVVLAVMCLLMGTNGIVGLRKTQDEHMDRVGYADRYAKRIETYVELDKELEGSISYEEAYAELEKIMEEHDKDASQHKTDTAMYSAEKGGNTMGANIIWELMPQLKGAKLELEKGKQQLEDGEAQLQQSKAAYEAYKPVIDGLVARADNGVPACNVESAKLESLMGGLSTLMAQEPVLPEKPVEPVAPVAPEAPAEPPEGAGEAGRVEYEAAVAVYNEKLAQYEAEKAAYAAAVPEYERSLEKYNKDLEEYEAAHAAWEKCCKEYRASADFMSPIGVISAKGADITALAADAAPVLEALGAGASAGGQMPSVDPSVIMGIAAANPAELSNQQFLTNAGTLKGILDAISGGYSAISGGLSSIGPGIAAGEAALVEARAKLQVGEEELKKGEAEAIKQLELIWYNLGELEKDKTELEENKQELDKEAGMISKKLMETDELKALENKRTSTRLILTGVKEVKEMYQENKDLVGSANAYLDSYKAETGKLYTGKLVLNILAIIGGIAGFVGIPAAFEKIKKRFWLLSPVILCLFCACAADGINMYLGLGQMYTALFAAIFAAIQLLVISPKAVSALE